MRPIWYGSLSFDDKPLHLFISMVGVCQRITETEKYCFVYPACTYSTVLKTLGAVLRRRYLVRRYLVRR